MNPRKRIPATLTAILAILALTACGETPKGDGFTNVHVNAISDSTQPFTRTNPETIQAYEEGKQLMQARYGRFDAMKEARHINPYRDGDR